MIELLHGDTAKIGAITINGCKNEEGKEFLSVIINFMKVFDF